jgi:sugar phosphate isomerase/epimerase
MENNMKRIFLSLTAALVVSYAALSNAMPANAQQAGKETSADKLGWKLAMHSYTFQKFSIFDAIDKTAALGLKYMTISGSVSLDGKTKQSTIDLKQEDWDKIQQKLDANGIKLLNMGVVQLPPDEAKSRKVFEFAKKIGIDTLIAEPTPEALDTVEKLCKEYSIKVAFHNHPKPSRYWNPDTVLEAIKDRTPLMGDCADTGHWIRSNIEPIDALKKLQGHVICFHFKDLNQMGPGAHDVPWGTGVGRIKEVLTEMKRQGFKGTFGIEYEYNWENSSPEIAECIKYFNSVCDELAAESAPVK